MKTMIDSSNTASLAQLAASASHPANQGPRVSIFGIIIVGLLTGLIVGLLTSPANTIQGFFLGFAGGSLVTTAAYFLTTAKGQPSK